MRALGGMIDTDAKAARAARIIREISFQRLRMRNEQFGFPVSDGAIKTLDQAAREPLFKS